MSPITLSNSIGASPPWSLWITDPSPQITSVTPDRPWQPGETVTVQINGKGFGSNPRVSLRASNGETVPCLGSEIVSIIGPPQGTARDSQIVISKSIPVDSSGCAFDMEITSSGLSGQFFQGNKSSPKGQAVVTRGVVLTQARNRTVTFIVHGISDSKCSCVNLRDNLRRETGWKGINPLRVVDAESNFPDCASIEIGAIRLANHVLAHPFEAGDRIAFVGHSMGGLIIRKMLADNRLPPTAPPVVGLVTHGTPHLGYPYLPIDGDVKCSIRAQEMESDLASGYTLNPPTLSPFLFSLRQSWTIDKVGGKWFAAGGTACAVDFRFVPGLPLVRNGCRVDSPHSDSVVCLDSSTLIYPFAAMTPTSVFSDGANEYQHGASVGLFIGAEVDPIG